MCKYDEKPKNIHMYTEIVMIFLSIDNHCRKERKKTFIFMYLLSHLKLLLNTENTIQYNTMKNFSLT